MEEKSVAGVVSGQQQFNLKWNNHTNNILQVFMEQFASEGLVDVTIACDGHFIKAHKMVLSACSPYFQEIFRIHTVTHPVIIVNGMKYSDLKQIIEFMYRGEVKVLETELDSLLAVAESLQVKGLSSVRNTCNKETEKSNEQTEKEQINGHNDDTIPRAAKRKKSKSSDSTSKPDELSDDESLASSIKIEPPEINDIDQDEIMQVDTNEDKNNGDQQTSEDKFKSKRISRPTFKKQQAFVPILPKVIMPLSAIRNSNSPIKISKVSKVPRPPNAFMIFANEWRRKLASEHPKESNKEISVRLGIMWKNLSSDTKEGYYSQSRKADEEHKRKYPGYYYSPKEARIRKNMKTMECVNKKRSIDAMHLVKLVMTEGTIQRVSLQQDKVPEEIEEEADVDVEEETTEEGMNISDEIDLDLKETTETLENPV